MLATRRSRSRQEPQRVSEAAGTQADQTLQAIKSDLEARFGSRSLFTGDEGDSNALTDTATILAQSLTVLNAAANAGSAYGDLATQFNDPGGLFDTTFYEGGTGTAPPPEVAAGNRVDFAIRADDPALRSTLLNVTVLTLAFDPDSGLNPAFRESLAQTALDGMRTDIASVVTRQSELGIAQQRIAEALSSNQTEEATLKISFTELAGRDPFEAAAELTALETQLETAYLTTARLSNLSLANFL